MHWYEPTDRGLELKIKEKMERLKALNDEARKKALKARS